MEGDGDCTEVSGKRAGVESRYLLICHIGRTIITEVEKTFNLVEKENTFMRAVCNGDISVWAKRIRWGDMRICPPKISLFRFNTSSFYTFKQKLTGGECVMGMNVCVKS